MLEPIVFSKFELKFPYNRGIDELALGRKLGYLANHDGMVYDQDIFSYGIVRYDFPELFDAVLKGELYKGTFELASLVLKKHQIDVVFCLIENTEKKFRIGLPLIGTFGEIQAVEADGQVVNIKWNDGTIVEAERRSNSSATQIPIPS